MNTHPIEMKHKLDELIGKQWAAAEPTVPEMHFKFYDQEFGEAELCLMKIDLYLTGETEDPTYIYYDEDDKMWHDTFEGVWEETELLKLPTDKFFFIVFFWDQETFDNNRKDNPSNSDGWFDEGTGDFSREEDPDSVSIEHICHALGGA